MSGLTHPVLRQEIRQPDTISLANIHYLREIYESDQIDLSLFAHLNYPDLRDHIERVGQVFYEKPLVKETGGHKSDHRDTTNASKSLGKKDK